MADGDVADDVVVATADGADGDSVATSADAASEDDVLRKHRLQVLLA